MKRSNVYLLAFVMLLLVGSIDVSMPTTNDISSPSPVCAGVNAKQVQQVVKKGWSLLKSCASREPKSKIEPIKPIKPIIPVLQSQHVRDLFISLENAKSANDVLPKISEYLSKTKPKEGGKLVIRCIKNDANEVRLTLYNNSMLRVNTMLTGVREGIKLAEYDVKAMQERFYKGVDGVEYVDFVIPKYPQYILNGNFEGRIYECMIFNIPKDIEGKWMAFKEYLIALFDDILNRPEQLWNEYKFRRELVEMNINSRDVNEIKQYMFAQDKSTKNYGVLGYIQKEVA